jgi:hypothetical protein
MTYMTRFTFAVLNQYLDQERSDLFPDEDLIFVGYKGVVASRLHRTGGLHDSPCLANETCCVACTPYRANS